MRMETMIENEQRQTSSHLESHSDMPLTPLTGKPYLRYRKIGEDNEFRAVSGVNTECGF